MGSLIEMNDTLQISSEQGFPKELDYEQHKIKPFTADDFEGKIFEFKDKPKVRIYQLPPVRNFLVQNINGKWLYWGLIHVIEVVHDNIKQTTSGKFKITYVYTPEEMKCVHELIDRNKDTDFLNVM
ncbi:hypothetical protein CMI37_08035 [Candidatus Pacearchaeota archaeon]|nr:hypothetical protein [Candidatus Pacearchaeota archaeon]|tara:strand:+ start:10185 stop:10562 length:378 start_codon:yes stop_codon:yes gene_type:complete